MDDGRAAWMCSCLKESRVRARPGTSGEEGTLPRGSKHEEGRPGPRTSDATATETTEKGVG